MYLNHDNMSIETQRLLFLKYWTILLNLSIHNYMQSHIDNSLIFRAKKSILTEIENSFGNSDLTNRKMLDVLREIE